MAAAVVQEAGAAAAGMTGAARPFVIIVPSFGCSTWPADALPLRMILLCLAA
jgi:hypothetical protein